MMGKTHLAGVIFVYGALNSFVPQLVPPLVVGQVAVPGLVPGLPLAILAGMLPDIDEEHSWISNPRDRVPIIGPVLQIIAQAVAFVLNRLPIIRRVIGHRTITHSGLALLVMGLLALRWEQHFHSLLLLAPLVGYGTHLILDGLTPAGVALFWPLPVRVRFAVTFPSRGAMNSFLHLLFLAGIAWLVYRTVAATSPWQLPGSLHDIPFFKPLQ